MDKRYITSSIFLFLAAIIFVVFIDPKYREMKVLSDDLTAKKNELAGRQNLILEIEKINKEFAPSLGNLEKIDKFLPKNVNVSDLLLQMDYITSRNGLVIKNIEFSPKLIKKKARLGKYSVLKIKMDLSGTHNSFLNFADDIKKNIHLMDIVDFSVSTNKLSSENEAKTTIDPILNYSLTIDAYYQN